MARIDELVEADAYNYGEGVRVLTALSERSLPAIQVGVVLLEEANRIIGCSGLYDKYQAVLERWAADKGVRGEATLEALDQAVLLGGAGADSTAGAKEALQRSTAFILRANLFLRLQRDYVLAYAELLRFRSFAAFGYLRLQAEGAALIRYFHDRPAAARQWMDTAKADAGKRFHQEHHRAIRTYVNDLGLGVEYDEASGMAQHIRVMGIAPGYLIGAKDRPKHGTIEFVWTDVDDPTTLLLWFWRLLGFHRKILSCIEQMFPDIPRSAFAELDRACFRQEVERIERIFKARCAAERQRGLVPGLGLQRREQA